MKNVFHNQNFQIKRRMIYYIYSIRHGIDFCKNEHGVLLGKTLSASRTQSYY